MSERIGIQELYQQAIEAKNIKSVERLKNVTGYEIYADSLDKIMKGEPTLVFNYLKGNDVGTLYSLLTHKGLREIAFRDPNFMFGVTNHRDNDQFRWLLHRYPGLWELIKEAIKSPDPILSQFSKPVLNSLTLNQLIQLRSNPPEYFSYIKSAISNLSSSDLFRLGDMNTVLISLSDDEQRLLVNNYFEFADKISPELLDIPAFMKHSASLDSICSLNRHKNIPALEKLWPDFRKSVVDSLANGVNRVRDCLERLSAEQITELLDIPEFMKHAVLLDAICLLNQRGFTTALEKLWPNFRQSVSKQLEHARGVYLVRSCLQRLSVEQITDLLDIPEFMKHAASLDTICLLNNQRNTPAMEKLWPNFKQSILDSLEHADGVDRVQGCLERLSVEQITDLLKNQKFRDFIRRNDLSDVGQEDIRELLQSIQPQAVDQSLGLRRLAEYGESSMAAVPITTQRAYAKLVQHYHPIDTPQRIEELKAKLRQLYDASPAMLEGKPLPYDWEAFNALNLPENEKQQALKQYYQNKYHTAARYLMKPNSWLADDAEHIDSANRCANFRNFLPEIALFYTAAIDEKSPPIDGFTMDGRLKYFIDRIADINRAHNWDKSRQVSNKERSVSTEYYDDLQGDKPSCPGGVDSRLLQSVMGHELTKIPDKTVFNQELTDMVKEHFGQLISKHDVNQLDKAYKITITLEEDASEEETAKLQVVLKSLDIPEQKIEEFMVCMKEKYQEDFTPEMEIFLRSRLDFRNLPSHAAAFAIELGQVIDEKKQSMLKGFGFFDKGPADMPPPSFGSKPQ